MQKEENFHYLIEIAVKLNDAIDENEHLSTPGNRKRYTFWKNKLKDWIRENYSNDGINQVAAEELFNQ